MEKKGANSINILDNRSRPLKQTQPFSFGYLANYEVTTLSLSHIFPNIFARNFVRRDRNHGQFGDFSRISSPQIYYSDSAFRRFNATHFYSESNVQQCLSKMCSFRGVCRGPHFGSSGYHKTVKVPNNIKRVPSPAPFPISLSLSRSSFEENLVLCPAFLVAWEKMPLLGALFIDGEPSIPAFFPV